MNDKVLAIIPAKENSKGIPQKNIRNLGGKPLISHTINEALKSKYINRVVLSTDSEKIAEVAKTHGAEVPFIRPKELATFTSSSLSVILHTLDCLKRKENYIPDIIVFLQPTSPFRNNNHIDEAIKIMLEDQEIDGVFGAKKVEDHPYMMFSKNNNGMCKPHLEMESRPVRRQEFPEIFVTNASLYVTRTKYYETAKDPDPVCPIFTGKTKMVVMDEFSSKDIDEELDFMICEEILKNKNG